MKLRYLKLFFFLLIASPGIAQIKCEGVDLKESVDFKKVTLKNLSERRAEVWSSWKDSNNKLNEEKLPNLVPLTDVKPNKWELIGEEPMPFYWGSKGDKPQEGYPLFINIHGSGPKEHEWSATLSWAKKFEDAPSVYFIPQIPTTERYRWWYIPEQLAWEKVMRLAFISELVNPNKIYFAGISEGGYGSQRLGAFYADYLAGAGPMAGGEPLDNAPVLNYRKIAFAFETGEKDTGFGRNQFTGQAKCAFDNLAMAYPGDFNHRIRFQEGRGHSIDYTLVTPWLVQFERNPHPKAFSWVNFPMHDRYRDGFYNLVVKEPFNVSADQSKDRTIFEFTIDGNSIYLDGHTFDTKTRELGEITQGKLRVFLSPELIDLSKKVTVYLNGNHYFSGKVSLNINHLIESCETFGDPMRLYPAAIDVEF